MHQGKCRACGAGVIFIQTPTSKWMVCNTMKLSTEEVKLGTRLVMDDGRVVTIKTAPREGYGQFGYIPHWATCTDPNRFRKKRA